MPANVAAAPSVEPVVGHAYIIVVELTPTMADERLAKVKEGIAAVADTLDRKADRFAVIDGAARVVVELGPPAKKLDALGRAGNADVDAALQLAGARLRVITAKTKSVFLVSDAKGGSVEVVKALRREGVNLSALGLDRAGRNALYDLTEAGEGRLYMVEDLDMLPRVFAKEAREAIRAGFGDEP